MGSIGGLFTGALALAAFQTVISSDRATSGFASLVQVPGKWARVFMDPAQPLIPNWAKAACAEKGDVAIFDLLTAGYQSTGQSPITQLPNTQAPPPGTLPPGIGAGKPLPNIPI